MSNLCMYSAGHRNGDISDNASGKTQAQAGSYSDASAAALLRELSARGIVSFSHSGRRLSGRRLDGGMRKPGLGIDHEQHEIVLVALIAVSSLPETIQHEAIAAGSLQVTVELQTGLVQDAIASDRFALSSVSQGVAVTSTASDGSGTSGEHCIR